LDKELKQMFRDPRGLLGIGIAVVGGDLRSLSNRSHDLLQIGSPGLLFLVVHESRILRGKKRRVARALQIFRTI
jgi:hypothetical protein